MYCHPVSKKWSLTVTGLISLILCITSVINTLHGHIALDMTADNGVIGQHVYIRYTCARVDLADKSYKKHVYLHCHHGYVIHT